MSTLSVTSRFSDESSFILMLLKTQWLFHSEGSKSAVLGLLKLETVISSFAECSLLASLAGLLILFLFSLRNSLSGNYIPDHFSSLVRLFACAWFAWVQMIHACALSLRACYRSIIASWLRVCLRDLLWFFCFIVGIVVGFQLPFSLLLTLALRHVEWSVKVPLSCLLKFPNIVQSLNGIDVLKWVVLYRAV